jgi:hypothetical protein
VFIVPSALKDEFADLSMILDGSVTEVCPNTCVSKLLLSLKIKN